MRAAQENAGLAILLEAVEKKRWQGGTKRSSSALPPERSSGNPADGYGVRSSAPDSRNHSRSLVNHILSSVRLTLS